jgi:hypothetical protein
MFVHVLYNVMVLFVSSSMLAIVVVMVLVSTCLVLRHVVMVHLMMMRMLVTSGVNVLVVLVMFAVHDKLLISCGGFYRHASYQLLNQPF